MRTTVFVLLAAFGAAGCKTPEPSSDGERLEQISARLEDPNAQTRREALQELSQWDPFVTAGVTIAPAVSRTLVTRVAVCLSDRNPHTRRLAASLLPRLGSPQQTATIAVPALIDSLREPDRDTRLALESSLARFGEAALPDLETVLRGNDARRSTAALRVVARIGPAAKPVRATVEEIAISRHGREQELAVEALESMGVAVPEAVATRTTTQPARTGSGRLSLQWNPVATSSDGSAKAVAGYRLHVGTTSGDYTLRFDAGPETEYTLAGLSPGTQYYVAVSAYDAAGLEGELSEEIVGTAR